MEEKNRGLERAIPDTEQLASVAHARDLADAALAMRPESPARAIMQALATPAVNSHHHLVTVTGEHGAWSTGVTVAPDGSVEIENPMVGAGLYRLVADGATAGIIVRSFTSEISHTLANGTRIPVKEVRGWQLRGGVFDPLDEQAMFAASCTDASTGEALAPERGVRYAAAYPVVT